MSRQKREGAWYPLSFASLLFMANHSALSLTDPRILSFCSFISSPTRFRSLLGADSEKVLALRLAYI